MAALLATLFAEEVVADPPKPAAEIVSSVEVPAVAPDARTSEKAEDAPGDDASTVADADRAAFDAYLDRLMRAESGGRDTAANPRSTALGPFQFIKSTFIDVARRHYGVEVQELSDEQLLRLRTDRSFARRCAEIYSRENHAFLAELGLKPTFGHLRLAFLLGPYAAARVLQASPATPVSRVLGAAVIRANPFMRRMSASNLIAKAARDVGETAREVDPAPAPHTRTVATQPAPIASPRPATRTAIARPGCNRRLASCRKFAAMQARRSTVRQKAKMVQSRAQRPTKSTADTRRRGAGV